MKKYVMLLLVVIMAVSTVSAAEIVTTKKADARTDLIILDPADTGKTIRFTGNDVNIHPNFGESSFPAPPAGTPPLTYQGFIGKKEGHNWAFVKVQSDKSTNHFGRQYNGKIGLSYRLNHDKWTEVQNRHVRVTICYYYDIATYSPDNVAPALKAQVSAQTIPSIRNNGGWFPLNTHKIETSGNVERNLDCFEATSIGGLQVHDLAANPAGNIFTGSIECSLTAAIRDDAANAPNAHVQAAFGSVKINWVDITFLPT